MKKNEYLRQLFFIQTLKDLVILEAHAIKEPQNNKILYEIAEFLTDRLVKHEKFGELVQILVYNENEPELSVKEEITASGCAAS